MIQRDELASPLSSAIQFPITEFEADPNAVNSACAAFLSMEASTSVQHHLVPVGTYLVDENLTLTKDISIRPGGMLRVSNGVTLTIVGGFDAPQRKVFDCIGSGRVVFAGAATMVGYPEWWGAVADAIVDNTQAINSCIVACPITQLGKGDYYHSNPILMQTPHRKLRGAGKSWTAAGGTRLCNTSADKTSILMGLNTKPAEINAHLQHVYVEDLAAIRTVQVGTGAAFGINVQYTLFCGVRNVEMIEHKVGLYASGVVHGKFFDNYAFRSSPGGAGTVPTTDSFYGYLLDGNSGIAAAGGNASIYFDKCSAACAQRKNSISTIVGFGIAGGPADVFVTDFEGTTLDRGIVVSGSGTQSGDADVHITRAILDGIETNGVVISNYTGALSIQDSYAAPRGDTAAYTGFLVSSSNGVSACNNQWVCWPYGGAIGVVLVASSLVRINSDIILGAAWPVIVDACASCEISPTISNPSQSVSGHGAVVVKNSTNRCFFGAAIGGGVNRISYGYELDGSCTLNELRMTMMSPSVIGQKLMFNGSAVSSVGVFGNANVAVGTF